jgi:hypothetical protein
MDETLPAPTGTVVQDTLRDKLSGIFVSMEKNLNLQTQTLQGMYKLQQDSFIMEKNKMEDDRRAERFAKDEDAIAPTSQKPERINTDVDGVSVGSSVGDLIKDVINGLSVSNLVKGVGVAILGTVVKGYIEKWIESAFGDDTDGDGEGDKMPEGIRKTLLDALLTGGTLGAIGRIFGKRIGALAAGAGFFYELSQDAIQSFNSAFGTNLDPEFWGMIGGVIAGALALRLPGIISAAMANGLRGMRVPNPFSRNPAAPRPGAGGDIKTNSGRTIPQRNWTREMVDGEERFRYKNGNLAPKGSSVETSMREAYQRDQRLLRDLERDSSRTGRALRNLAKFAKVNAAIGAIISVPRLYEIYTAEDLSQEEKHRYIASELGALGGGILGGAIGALGGSVVPGLGTFIGGAIGGAVGSFYGEQLASYAADLLLGDGNAEFDPDAAKIGQFYDEAAGSEGGAFTARPTMSGMEGDFAKADWDARFSGYLDPETGAVLENAAIPERPSEDENYGLNAAAWDRQWKAIQAAAQEGTNLAPNMAFNQTIPQPEYNEAELADMTNRYLQDLDLKNAESGSGVVAVDNSENVGQVVHNDNRSNNYFITNSSSGRVESSLQPFF